MWFVGYSSGLYDGLEGPHTLGCTPSVGLAAGQVATIFARYIDAHPEKWHLDADELMVSAMTEAYPCKKR